MVNYLNNLSNWRDVNAMDAMDDEPDAYPRE